jgi:hypothetical protein
MNSFFIIFTKKTMKQKLHLLFTGLLLVGTFTLKAQLFGGGEAAKKVYKSDDFKETIASHKTVAIIPFTAAITYKKKPKDYNEETVREDEKKLRTTMQQGMYTYLLKKNEKYSVEFQEVDRTNILLKKAGMIDRLEEVLPDSIALVLGVDAVIKCHFDHELVGGSEGGQIAKSLLFGSRTGSGGLTMQIYDGKKGKLLWRFYKEMNEGITSNANEIMDRMMRKVSRNFPY